MKKQYVVIGIIVAAILAAAVMYVSRSPQAQDGPIVEQETPIIESDDGFATLEIPESALPEGITLDDISIARKETDEDGLFIYSLEPSGTQFEEPITVSFEQPLGLEGGIPIAFHVFDEEAEPVDDTRIQFDLAGKTMRIEGDITHFSDYVFSFGFTFFKYTIVDGPKEHFVGESFESLLMIEPNFSWDGQIIRGMPSGYHGPTRHAQNEPYIINKGGEKAMITRGQAGEYSSEQRIVLTPVRMSILEQSYALTEIFYLDPFFTCEREGRGFISTSGFIPIDYKLEVAIDSPKFESASRIRTISARTTFGVNDVHDCVLPPGLELEEVEGRIGDDLTLLPSEPDGGASPGGESGNIVTGGEGRLLMLKISGSYYPESQFVVKAAGAPEPEHECPRPHYHPRTGQEVHGLLGATSEDLSVLSDPNPTACGFGLFDDIERVNLPTTIGQRDVLREYISSF